MVTLTTFIKHEFFLITFKYWVKTILLSSVWGLIGLLHNIIILSWTVYWFLWIRLNVIVLSWTRLECFYFHYLTSLSPERISNSLMRSFPSRKSVYKSPTRQLTRQRWEFTHFVNVFFCTCSRSTEKKR